MTIPGVDIINLIQLVMAVKYRASKSAYIVCTSNCVYMFVHMYMMCVDLCVQDTSQNIPNFQGLWYIHLRLYIMTQ